MTAVPRGRADEEEQGGSVVVLAPVAGRVLALDGVPDPVFAQAMVGPGLAVDPDRGPVTAIAPADGRIVKLHPHAFVIATAAGRGVLVHLGIDTVQLKGEGFSLLVAEGAEVTAGTPVIRWDAAAVEAGGRSPICPVIALDATADDLHRIADEGSVEQGAELFRWS